MTEIQPTSQASLWEAAAKSIATGAAQKPDRPTLDSMLSKRSIFEGMSYLFFANTGDGKTYLTQSPVLTGRDVYVLDTETRAIDTRDVQFSQYKDKIKICEPVVIRADKFVNSTNLDNILDAIDLNATFDNIHNFLMTFALEVINGKIPKNSVLVVESVTDFWAWIQHAGKSAQATKKGKRLDEITKDDIEWTPITDKHNKIILALNSLRSLGITVIYTARYNDSDTENAREVRSQKDLPYNIQNIFKLTSEVRGVTKIYIAQAEKLLGQPAYERFENTTFDKLDQFVRTNIQKIIAGSGVPK